MMEQPDIGPDRDLILARALEQHFDTGAQDDRLAARIYAVIRISAPESGFDVLAAWLRPGLMAAAAVALAVLFWGTYFKRPAPMEAALAPSVESLLSAAVGTEVR